MRAAVPPIASIASTYRAVIVFAIVTGFMLLGAYPLSIGENGSARDFASVAATVVFGAMWAVVCPLKGKLMWAVIGVYVGPVAVIGALRLARPDAWWGPGGPTTRRSSLAPGRGTRARLRYTSPSSLR